MIYDLLYLAVAYGLNVTWILTVALIYALPLIYVTVHAIRPSKRWDKFCKSFATVAGVTCMILWTFYILLGATYDLSTNRILPWSKVDQVEVNSWRMKELYGTYGQGLTPYEHVKKFPHGDYLIVKQSATQPSDKEWQFMDDLYIDNKWANAYRKVDKKTVR